MRAAQTLFGSEGDKDAALGPGPICPARFLGVTDKAAAIGWLHILRAFAYSCVMSTPPRADEPVASPRQLAERAQNGDRAAFEQLVRRYDAGLRRILLRRTGGNVTLAEELAHDTWIAVWEAFRAGRYDARKAAISTFVYAVAYKRWLQHLRRAGRAPAAYDLLGLMGDESGASGNPASLLEAGEMLDAMRACLHTQGTPLSLTDEERHVVVGLSRGETERTLAAQLGLAASTVHTRKQLAYKKLRGCMTAKGYSQGGAERRRRRGEQS